MAIQTQECELANVVSGHKHLSTHRHIHTTVPKAGKKKQKKINLEGIRNDKQYILRGGNITAILKAITFKKSKPLCDI